MKYSEICISQIGHIKLETILFQFITVSLTLGYKNTILVSSVVFM